jgi:glutathione S-transferase
MTIADLCLHNFFNSIFFSENDELAMDASVKHLFPEGFSASLLDDYPFLKSHNERIEQLPAVSSFQSKYLSSFETFTFRPGT